MPRSHRPDRPSIWLLLDDRPGHRTQVLGLARGLKGQISEKHLSFNRLNHIPNPVLGASLTSLDKTSRQALSPPFPDLVIGMGRRTTPIARWIKRQSGGKTKLVLLGRKALSNPRDIDLMVSCAHFELLPDDNLVELIVPPTQVDGAAMKALRAERPNPIKGLKRPHIVFLLGGPTSQHFLGADFAWRMAAEIKAAASAAGGGLAIVTSRRTPSNVIAAIKKTAGQAHIHEWRAGRQDNPYLAYLAHADLLVVSGESESMLAEAIATKKPLTIYPFKPRPRSLKLHLAAHLRQQALRGGALAPIGNYLLKHGWIVPPRDLALMHGLIESAGLGLVFAGKLNQKSPKPNQELQKVSRRIAKMLKLKRDKRL